MLKKEFLDYAENTLKVTIVKSKDKLIAGPLKLKKNKKTYIVYKDSTVVYTTPNESDAYTEMIRLLHKYNKRDLTK
jgi:hypothetical protein